MLSGFSGVSGFSWFRAFSGVSGFSCFSVFGGVRGVRVFLLWRVRFLCV